MAWLLDTNVAIHVRDGAPAILDRVAALSGAVLLSVVSRVELEGGVWRDPTLAAIRQARLEAMLTALPVLAFGNEAANAYAAIVARCGYSHRKLLDRMIAAQAIVARATLVTMNPGDFADIPDLSLDVWSPAAGGP